MVCAKEKMPLYPALRKGEDTPVMEQLISAGRVIVMDCPRLYTYTFHGNNTFDRAHFESHLQAATEIFDGQTYRVMVARLQEELALPQAMGGSHSKASIPRTAHTLLTETFQ